MSPNQRPFFSIRSGTKQDIPSVKTVILAAFAELRDEVPAPFFEAYTENLRSLAENWKDAELLVAEVGGRIAGTIFFYADASIEGLGLPESWSGFRTLAVLPAFRGLGIGRVLTSKCVGMARRLGARTVGIHTASCLSAACRVYSQTGFCRCPEYDVRASKLLPPGDGIDDVTFIAYRLDDRRGTHNHPLGGRGR